MRELIPHKLGTLPVLAEAEAVYGSAWDVAPPSLMGVEVAVWGMDSVYESDSFFYRERRKRLVKGLVGLVVFGVAVGGMFIASLFPGGMI